MKKIMTIIAVLSVVLMPFANVKAIEIKDCAASESCFVYTPGMEVNFYRSVKESELNDINAGLTTIILEDGGKGQQYVKTLVIGSPFSTDVPYYDGGAENEPMTLVKKDHESEIQLKSKFQWDSAKHDAEGKLEFDYITLEDVISVFGATKQDNNTYKIDVAKWGKVFGEYVFGELELDDGSTKTLRTDKGFYTSTYDKEEDKVWVVEYTLDKDNITDITVKQVTMTNNNEYAYYPVVYFDKTFDCTSRITADDMACYSCADADGKKEYRWLQKGAQAETCTLVPEVTSAGTCVTAVKTGVEDYVLEFVGITLICGIALVIVKKKDLFRTI